MSDLAKYSMTRSNVKPGVMLLLCSVAASKYSNMATGMRITAVVSLVLVLVSLSRGFSAQLPIPATCFERCPVDDAECVDACVRRIEAEEELPGDKRASAFVRIGRPALDKRASSFIRIGKKEFPADGLDVPKRKDSFVRIGRASAFVRIGRGQAVDAENPKRTSSFIRVGKSSDSVENPEDAAIEVDTTGNKRTSSSFVRIGRGGDRAEETDERWLYQAAGKQLAE